MKIIEFIIFLLIDLKYHFLNFILDRGCWSCQGSNGQCCTCKYNGHTHGKQNLFKRDWKKSIYKF